MGTRVNQIREACQLSPDYRTEEMITEILEFVREVKFFAKLSLLQQRTLCRTMTLESFNRGDTIFKAGDPSDKFYIVLAGQVGIQVPEKSGTATDEFKSFVHKGDSFGDFAVEEKPRKDEESSGDAAGRGQPRTFTVKASVGRAPSGTANGEEATACLVTTRADYEKYAGELHKLFIEQRVKFLRQCPLIEEALDGGQVTNQDIMAMANCLNERSLHGNEMVVRQGESVENMIFVKSGSLAMLRLIEADAIAKSPRSQRKGASAADTRSSGRGRPGRSDGKGGGKGKGRKASSDQASSSSSDNDSSDNEEDSNDKGDAMSLARAMIALKQQERDQKLGTIFMQRRKSEEEASEMTSHIFGRRSSFSLDNVASPSNSQKDVLSLAAGASGRPSSQDSKASKASVSDDNDGESGEDANRAKTRKKSTKALWGTIGTSLKKAFVLRQSVKSFSDVKKENAQNSQKTTEPKKPLTPPAAAGKRNIRATQRQGESMTKDMARVTSLRKAGQPKKQLLRIGSVGPFQYFGDKEVCTASGVSKSFPCSLVSDPIAEIYTISKHDILRRLNKNLFSALFAQESQADPTDVQLLEMLRQNERWFAFRRSMHGEAMIQRDQERALTGQTTSGSRVDAVSNLEFLGINPQGSFASRTLPPPRKTGADLTAKDEELFSQTSARFLRRFDMMKKDPGLQIALSKAGLSRRLTKQERSQPENKHRLRKSLDNEDVPDPMAIRFDQHWSKLRQDPIKLDLGEEDDFRSSMPRSLMSSLPSEATSTSNAAALQKESQSGGAPTPAGWTAAVTTELPPIVETSARSPPQSAEARRGLSKVGFSAS
mmetsp:Transcript_105329/g.187227  ORF Transcript_105329/g.187227 Transcript_105329/m.187227 type:complete len:828 (+) Transcript_105329:130-2613(+)